MRRRSTLVLTLSVTLSVSATAQANIECPDGAQRRRVISSERLEQYCVLDLASGKELRHGVYQRFWREHTLDGGYWQKQETGQYWRGRRVGRWYAMKDFRVESVGKYPDSIPSGIWEEWYFGGRRRVLGRFENEKKVGLWKHWAPNGCLEQEATYDDGEVLERRIWRSEIGCSGLLQTLEETSGRWTHVRLFDSDGALAHDYWHRVDDPRISTEGPTGPWQPVDPAIRARQLRSLRRPAPEDPSGVQPRSPPGLYLPQPSSLPSRRPPRGSGDARDQAGDGTGAPRDDGFRGTVFERPEARPPP